MPYRNIIFTKGECYHVFNRGNRKENIFLDNQDKKVFLNRVKKYKEECGIIIFGFCLMPNHFHFLLRQETGISVSDFIHKTLISYSMYFNKKYATVGRLFQGPFKAKQVIDDEYLLQLSRYIHLNPLEISKAHNKTWSLADYPWSSYPDYLGRANSGLCNKDFILSYFSKNNPSLSYKYFIEKVDPEVLKEQLKDLIFE